jgi:hypothetical protein
VRVRFADEQPSGLALMLGGLIQQNLERDPGRARHLDGSVVAIVAPDADVAVSIAMGPDDVVVSDGVRPDAHLVVTASSKRLLHVTSSPLRFGLPDAMSRHGRQVIGHVLSGRVRIEGLVRSPHRLARLTRLLSVNEPK